MAKTPPALTLPSNSGRQPTRIQSVSRAIRLVRLASRSTSGITADDAADHLGVSLATAYHLLNTLVSEGMLAKHDRLYHLGPEVGMIADAYLRYYSAPPYLLAPLSRLARTIGETASLCVWRHGDVIEVAAFEGTNPLKVGLKQIGPQPYPHARASGKLLLAALTDRALADFVLAHPLERLTPNTIVDIHQLREELRLTRERGWAIEIEECDEGVACLAVSVVADATAGVAAYTVGAPAHRLAENQATYLGALRAAAEEAAEWHGGS